MLKTEVALVTMDCIEGMNQMPPESVDLIVTSPPYNLGVKYHKYSDTVEIGKYLAWTGLWLMAAKRVLKPKGSLFLNLAGCPRKPLLPHQVVITATAHFVLQNTFSWVKSVSIERPGKDILSVGHFKPINSARFVNDCHESVFHFTKDGNVKLNRLALGVPYADQSNVKRWKHAGGRNIRCRGNVWFLPYTTIQSRSKDRPHPATFPPELAVNCIKLHGGVIETITLLDPFVGIGSAIIGGLQEKVGRAVGFDIDESYIVDANHFVEEKINRMAQAEPA